MDLHVAHSKGAALRLGAFSLALLMFAGACSARPERATVDEFFAASRLRDKTALEHRATVIFEPLENGVVESFEITNVAPQDENTKAVTVSAQVKLPQAREATQRTILLTLAKGALKN